MVQLICWLQSDQKRLPQHIWIPEQIGWKPSIEARLLTKVRPQSEALAPMTCNAVFPICCQSVLFSQLVIIVYYWKYSILDKGLLLLSLITDEWERG